MVRKRRHRLVYTVAFGLVGMLVAPAILAATENKNAIESAMDGVARSLGGQLAESGLRKLATAEFSDLNGYRSALGPFLADELMHRLFAVQPGVFDLIGHQQLAQSLEGRDTTPASLDAGALAAIGKALGVQAVVVGTISDLGEEIKVSISVLTTESARTAALASARFPRVGQAEALLRQTGSSFPPSAPARYVGNSRAFFKNDFLQVTVESLALSSKKDWVHLALVFENLTDQEVHLRADHDRHASLTSHAGDKFWSRSLEGLVNNWNDIWTTFAPRSRSVVAFSFKVADLEVENGSYSFSTTLQRRAEKTVTNFSMGIADIQLSAR